MCAILHLFMEDVHAYKSPYEHSINIRLAIQHNDTHKLLDVRG